MFYIPDKNTMIRKLLRDGYWVTGFQKEHNFRKGASIHFVQWLYFLNYCTYDLCEQIRQILHKKEILVYNFCALVARIYASTSSRIHQSLKPVDTQMLEEGLRLYGLSDRRLLDCVTVFNEMKNMPLSKYIFVLSYVIIRSRLSIEC